MQLTDKMQISRKQWGKCRNGAN